MEHKRLKPEDLRKFQQRMRELYVEAERRKEEDELNEILEQPTLTSERLWNISARNFYLWRRKHDLPRILNHFSEKLNGFNEWKKEYSITNDMLMNYGLSNCISPSTNRKKTKYFIVETWQNEKTKYISDKDLSKRESQLGPSRITYNRIGSFRSYLEVLSHLINNKVSSIKTRTI